MTKYEEVWDSCLGLIKDNVSLQGYKTWFEPIKPVKLDNRVLTIQVPSQFFYEWLEEHYIHLLKKIIRKELGEEGRLEYSIVMENSHNGTNPYTVKIPTSNKRAIKNTPVSAPMDIGGTKQIKNPFIIPGLRKINVDSNLKPNYSFDNLVEGDCNRLARSAGFAVAKNPGGTAFNPLLIYGGVGLGKTHLAQAIGIEIKNRFPNKTVLYVESEKFIHQFIDAVKNNNVNDFSHFYQMMDVLIIDDVQFLAGKEKTQDMFFHIFNHLHQTGKQIVLTSDKAPVEMQGMDELEGALISLIAHSSLNKKPITLDLAKQMIDKFVKNTAREVSIDYIQKVVCDYFDLPIELLKSKTRKREVVQARQIAMYFAKKMTKSSLANIGMHCGGKDHATVLHACRTVNNLQETDKQFRKYLDDLEKKLSIQ
ncbi:MAG: chromosomal replication initiator protein DnaA [Flavobacteriales bacterium]|nr:chromosomal replication initiator protein DnaA [Flavobacteriales bacterium]